MNRSDLYAQEALFARDTMSGVVAVEPAGHFFRIFQRSGDEITFHDIPFRPFFLITDPKLADKAPIRYSTHQLAGEAPLKWLLTVQNLHDWSLLRHHLQQSCLPGDWYGIHDIRQQFLVSSGINFFRQLSCHEVRFICIAVQTSAGDPHLKNDHDAPLQSIAVTDGNVFEVCIDSGELSEAEMLERLSAVIRELDPDVIAGYNLTGIELPCLVRRATLHGIRLEWGRNGAALHSIEHRNKKKSYEIYGRSIVDIRSLIRYYHQQIHPLPDTGLHPAADWFGCSEADKEMLSSAAKAAHRSAQLYRLLAPAWHLQAQIYPISFQSAVALDGSKATTVQALLTREYLLQQQALPAVPDLPVTAKRDERLPPLSGRFGPIAYCDLSVLPASIMLSYRIASRGDKLGIMLSLLQRVIQAGREPAGADKQRPSVNLYRLLLNPWYELLSNNHFPFSDPVAAEEVHRLERVFQNDLLHSLEEQKAVPVLLDSQGIYFVPPPGHSGKEEVAILLGRLSLALPKGVYLNITEQYKAMFIYSTGTYALLEFNGEMIVRGSSFASRSMEPFLREFLRESIRLLLTARPSEIKPLYESYIRRLAAHDCPVDWVKRTETLTEPLSGYRQAVQTAKRKRAAAYELALNEPDRWNAGDRVSYYVTGNSKNIAIHSHCRLVQDFDPARQDINIPWYTEKLHLLFNKLVPLIPEEPLLLE